MVFSIVFICKVNYKLWKITMNSKWYEVMDDVMKEIVVARVEMSLNVKRALKKSRDLPLVYASKQNKYWSSGMCMKLTERTHPTKYKGRNRLGELWMEVRKEKAHLLV